MRAHAPSPSGFSMIELLVALAASMFVLLGATILLSSQQRSFTSTSAERALQESGRIALDSIAADLRLAGFGVDPALAFDLGTLALGRVAMIPSGASFTTSPLACGTDLTCRDRVDGPDELVFLARDPAFGKPLTAAATSASSQLTVQGPLNTPLHKGQILQVLCYTGKMAWSYVQVSQSVAAGNALSVNIPIDTGTTIFPKQNNTLADSCFSSVLTTDPASAQSAARVFKVDRTRYFIQSYDAGGNKVTWGTAGSRPWLMADRGLTDTGHGNAAVIDPVAPDVEDLQVAYVFPADTVTPVVGATSGTVLSNDDSGVNLAALSPIFGEDPAAPSRLTHHPGNIRAVRVAVVVRSAEPDLAATNPTTIPAAFNRPAITGAPAYRRLQLQTTVSVRNLDARAPYYPVYGTGTDQLNVGGG